jgi:hypothetical protein
MFGQIDPDSKVAQLFKQLCETLTIQAELLYQ